MEKRRVLAAVSAFVVAVVINLVISYYTEHWVEDLPWDLLVLFVIGLATFTTTSYLKRTSFPYTERWRKFADLQLALKRVFAGHLQFFFPHRGYCYRCYMPWLLSVTRHSLIVEEMFGIRNFEVFAMCEDCHHDTHDDVEQRMGCYGMMLTKLYQKGLDYKGEYDTSAVHREWLQLRDAVIAEFAAEHPNQRVIPPEENSKIA